MIVGAVKQIVSVQTGGDRMTGFAFGGSSEDEIVETFGGPRDMPSGYIDTVGIIFWGRFV